MKKVILMLILAAKMYSQSPVKFESSQSPVINANSELAISAGMGDNIIPNTKLPLISSSNGKNVNYEKLINHFFYNKLDANKSALNVGIDSTSINVSNSGNTEIIEKQYFKLSDNKVSLEKTETLIIINQQF